MARCGRKHGLVSETTAPTLTVSAFCDTEVGSVLQGQVPHCRIAELPFSQFEATIRAHSQRRQSTRFSRAPLLLKMRFAKASGHAHLAFE